MKYLVVLAWLVSLPIVALAQGEAVSETERNKALVTRFYEEAWHNDNYAVADEIFAPDYVRHDASDPVQGPGEAVLQSERAREVKETVPNLRFEYDVIMAEGDMVAVRWTSRGNPAGIPAFMRRLVGKSGPLVATGVNMYRFRDGRVVELWNSRDDLTIQREMGVLRWYAAGGFLTGVLITLLGGWSIRRWRSARGGAESAGAT
jgi:predicted SnoaL-like aldol condensation-catalyzing enzyme